jgi:mannose/fructose-specific phosphotransferase system component IIA
MGSEVCSDVCLVRIVLVAQGDLVKSLLETAVLITGELDQIEAVSFGAEESFDSLHAKVLEAMGRLGDEVGVLVDLPRGTPANVCMRVTAERGCEAVVGVYLPMLIETVLSCDDESAIAVAQTALQAGQEELVHLSELLPKPGIG